jgi:hypothetical protein
MKSMGAMAVAALTFVQAGCTSNGVTGTTPVPTQKTTPVPPITWAEASQADNLAVYAHFMREHPDEHVSELRNLAKKFLQDLAEDAKQHGKTVVHNATEIPVIFLTNGGTMTFQGISFPMPGGPIISDPTQWLALRGGANGTEYVRGRGLLSYHRDNTVYCFGF